MREVGRTGEFYGNNHREICGKKGEAPGEINGRATGEVHLSHWEHCFPSGI